MESSSNSSTSTTSVNGSSCDADAIEILKTKSHNFDAAKLVKKMKEKGYTFSCQNGCEKFYKTKEEATLHHNACPKYFIYQDKVREYNRKESQYPINTNVTFEKGATRASEKRGFISFVSGKGAIRTRDLLQKK